MKDFKKGLAVEGSKTENQPGYFSELFHLKDAAGQNIGMGMYHENESDPTIYYLIEQSTLVPYITIDLFNKYGQGQYGKYLHTNARAFLGRATKTLKMKADDMFNDKKVLQRLRIKW